ncbi:MAG: prephenate dehydratase [Chlorobi bacterium]|nr:prephenate dehydratase [Chlorobiota bacterium]
MSVNQKKRIAIQGGFGAFHEVAAIRFFEPEEVEIIPRNTFNDLFKSLRDRKADYGILAIENSIAGSILPNYNLLRESNKKIIGEIFLRIRLNLVALPGQKTEDLHEVYSHPMAILQSQSFFDKYPGIRVIESVDTALSAREIGEKELQGVGAIASELAAQKFNLEVLADGIETNPLNYTRFLVVSENGNHQIEEKPYKSSIYFTLSHKIGSLSKILSILSFYNMNLTKIQSIPVVGKEWEYQFYADLIFEDYELYQQAFHAIRPFTEGLGELGIYPIGKKII